MADCSTTCCRKCRNWRVKKDRCRYESKYLLVECSYPADKCKRSGPKCDGFRRKPNALIYTKKGTSV